ncbi:hypothetical protein AgCh_035728 [Apium graveolens]
MEMGWSLPPKGFVKVNMFGVFCENPLPNGNRSGLGIDVRDSNGDILLMVTGSLQILNERVNELWSLLLGLRGCLYVWKHKVILETEHVEAVAEWEAWSSFIDPRYSDVIRSLVKRRTDKRLKLHVSVVNESKNQLARFLAKDGALNRTLPVIMARPFGRVKEIWHRDMGLGTTDMGFDLVTEEQYRKIKEGDFNEDMEWSGVVVEKFIKVLTAFDTTLDEMLTAMVRFKQTARKTCDADAYVRAQQRAHSSSSSGSDDTIAFSVYAELRREFDMLQGKYDRLIDRLKNVYPDSQNYEGKPKEQMTTRLETLVQYVNIKLEEMSSHRDRTSQYIIQMVVDELQSIVKTLREEKTTKPRSD